MALRPKKPDSLAENPTAPALTEERRFRVQPEVDARLTSYMETNQKQVDYYSKLVKENPDRAVRALMLGRMMQHENSERYLEKQLPQVKEWVNQQPGLLEKIEDRIKNTDPLYRQRAFMREATREKARIDFAPPKVAAEASLAI